MSDEQAAYVKQLHDAAINLRRIARKAVYAQAVGEAPDLTKDELHSIGIYA